MNDTVASSQRITIHCVINNNDENREMENGNKNDVLLLGLQHYAKIMIL